MPKKATKPAEPAAPKWEGEFPPMPLIATALLNPEKMDAYCNAMADALCWLGGFTAAGGTYSPGSIEVLRDLSESLKTIQSQQEKPKHEHHTRPKTLIF